MNLAGASGWSCVSYRHFTIGLRASTEMLSLPVIDLANDPPALQAERIRSALGTIGFFEVRNAGLEPEEIQRMFELVRGQGLA